jgi:ATP-dependent DNA ligase
MSLPIWPPFAPMEGASVKSIPTGPEWQYEPKWDGFRCLAFRDGSRIELQSKSMKSLARYFPDLAAELQRLKATRFAIDGEIVIPVAKQFSFDLLLQRIHPAASRVAKLSKEYPARLIIFDLLVNARGRNLTPLPLTTRREELEAFAKKFFANTPAIVLSPATRDIRTAKRWSDRKRQTLDGVIAKRLDLEYRSAERDGMQKIKRMETAECVVGGFRYASKRKTVGSLLLGLYNEAGLLDHVGFVATGKSFGTAELTRQLEELRRPPGFTGKAPSGPSRWSSERTGDWQPLRPKLVVEVQYDHVTNGRFRHGTKFLRWRPDKTPKRCTLSQILTSTN